MGVKYALFVSGNGGFSRVLYRNRNLINNGELALVISDRKCKAIDHFKKNTSVISYIFDYKNYKTKESFEEDILEKLKENRIDYIFLNYNRLIGESILNEYDGKIINLHLSALPLYKGFGAIEKSYNSKELFLGATAHIVDKTIDGGDILAQVIIPKNLKDNYSDFSDELFKSACILFIDIIHKTINMSMVIENGKVFFAEAKYGELPYNPKLSINKERIRFDI